MADELKYAIEINVLKNEVVSLMEILKNKKDEINQLAKLEMTANEFHHSGFALAVYTDIEPIVNYYLKYDFNENLVIIDYVKFNNFVEKFNNFIEVVVKEFSDIIDQYSKTLKSDQEFSTKANEFCVKFGDLMYFCISLFQEFHEKQNMLTYKNTEFDQIKQGYDDIIIKNKSYESEFAALKNKYEAVIIDKDIEDIKNHYNEIYKNNTFNRTVSLYYFIISVIAMFTLVGWSFYKLNSGFLDKIANSHSNNFTFTLILLVSTFGLISFLITDARKRLNISLAILDEIQQKKVLVDSYSSLLGKAKNIEDNETKTEYEKQVLQNIISNILSIKNHGYIGKDMQNMSPNIYLDTLNKIYLEALNKTSKNST